MEKGAIRAVFQSKLAGLENEIGVDQLYDALGWIVEQLDGDDSDHSGQP